MKLSMLVYLSIYLSITDDSQLDDLVGDWYCVDLALVVALVTVPDGLDGEDPVARPGVLKNDHPLVLWKKNTSSVRVSF